MSDRDSTASLGPRLSVNCSYCNRMLEAPASQAGEQVRCTCGAMITVPMAHAHEVNTDPAPILLESAHANSTPFFGLRMSRRRAIGIASVVVGIWLALAIGRGLRVVNGLEGQSQPPRQIVDASAQTATGDDWVSRSTLEQRTDRFRDAVVADDVSFLLGFIHDPRTFVRKEVVYAIGPCAIVNPKKASSFLPVLTQAIEDDDEWVRFHAAFAMHEIGSYAAPALPDLLRVVPQRASAPDDPWVRARKLLDGLGYKHAFEKIIFDENSMAASYHVMVLDMVDNLKSTTIDPARRERTRNDQPVGGLFGMDPSNQARPDTNRGESKREPARESDAEHQSFIPGFSGVSGNNSPRDDEPPVAQADWRHALLLVGNSYLNYGSERDGLDELRTSGTLNAPIEVALQLVQDSDRGVRCGVLMLLGEKATRTKPVIAAIEELLKDKEPAIRKLANRALTKVKSRPAK